MKTLKQMTIVLLTLVVLVSTMFMEIEFFATLLQPVPGLVGLAIVVILTTSATSVALVFEDFLIKLWLQEDCGIYYHLTLR